MKRNILTWSVIAAWCMAIVYDRIETMTGMEINVLLVTALVTMIAGLYFGLYANSNETSEGRA